MIKVIRLSTCILLFQIGNLDSDTNQLALILGATRSNLDKINSSLVNTTLEVGLGMTQNYRDLLMVAWNLNLRMVSYQYLSVFTCAGWLTHSGKVEPEYLPGWRYIQRLLSNQTAGSKTVMQFRTVSSTRRIIFKLMPRARWNKYPITLIGYLSLYVLPKDFINPKYIIYEIPLPVFGGTGLSRVPLIIFFSMCNENPFFLKMLMYSRALTFLLHSFRVVFTFDDKLWHM